MMKFGKAALLCGSVSLCAVGVAMPATPVAAQQTAYNFNIPSKSLLAALSDYTATTGVQVVRPSSRRISGKSPAVTGQHSSETALRALLAGSGLTFQFTGPRTVALYATGGEDVNFTPGGDGIVLEVIEVAGAGQSGDIEPGNDQIVITNEDLKRIDPSDLQDVFKGEPAVSVGSSIPISQKIYVDGIEETNLAVTIDGSRQNNRIFHHNATTYIDPTMLKAVRVDPGVAPADAGPGALGGSIAFETRDAKDFLEPGKTWGGFVSGEYATNGETVTTSGSLYSALNGFETLGYLKWADGDNFEDGDGVEMRGTAAKLLSGLGKVAYETEGGHRFGLSYESVRDDGLRPNRADFIFIPPRPDILYDLNRTNAVFKYTNEKPDGWLDPEVVIAYSVTDLVADPSNEGSEGTTDSFNGKVQNTFAFGMGTVVAGFDFYLDKSEYRDRFGFSANEQADNVGAFAQARLDVTDRARLSFGGRADYQEFTGTNGFEDDNAGLSGNISGEYDLTDILTASAGYSHVWGGVRIGEPYIFWNPAWSYGDGIPPVESDNAFAGLKADFGSYFIEGRVFRTQIDDARVLYGAGTPIQLSDLDSYGYEIGAGYKWDTGFVRAGFADIYSEVDGVPANSDNARYLTAPIGERFVLSAAHTFSDYALTVGGDLEFAFEYDEIPGSEIPEYTVVNLFLEYVPDFVPEQFERVTFRAEVNNLFDETYADRATFNQEYPDDVQPLNEPGRSFAVKLTAEF